jgi:hypothetical protein
MATEVLLAREGNRLGACDPMSADVITAMKHGEQVVATIRRARNPKHHAKFMALVGAVFENQDRYATFRQVLNAIKIGAGYYDKQPVVIGQFTVEVYLPKSISFASMPQDDFEQFYNKAVVYIVTHMVPGLDSADLERRVSEIIGDYQPAKESEP